MKNTKRPSTSKLVASFDEELKNIILSDLKNIRNNKSNLTAA